MTAPPSVRLCVHSFRVRASHCRQHPHSHALSHPHPSLSAASIPPVPPFRRVSHGLESESHAANHVQTRTRQSVSVQSCGASPYIRTAEGTARIYSTGRLYSALLCSVQLSQKQQPQQITPKAKQGTAQQSNQIIRTDPAPIHPRTHPSHPILCGKPEQLSTHPHPVP